MPKIKTRNLPGSTGVKTLHFDPSPGTKIPHTTWPKKSCSF